MKKLLLLPLLLFSLSTWVQAQCTANAGADQTLCASTATTIGLSGSVTGGAAQWTTSGGGTFSDATSPTATYTFSAADKVSGAVTLTLTACGTVSDIVTFTLLDAPIVDAGPNVTSCGGATIYLSCTFANANSIDWSTPNGTGIFNPNTSSVNVGYVPTASDIVNGSVQFMVRTIGQCPSANDMTTATIIPDIVANAGPDQTICDGSYVNLNGTISGGSSAIWSTTGTGTFIPATTALNAIYAPSLADRANGSVTLTLTTTATGMCNPNSDNLTVTILSGSTAVVDAGPDQVVASGNVTLNGTVTNASTTIWTSAGSGSFTNTSTLNPVYVPSTADYINGVVVLTLTAQGQGSCPSVSDNVMIKLGSTYSLSGSLSHSSVAVNQAYVILFKQLSGTYLPFAEQSVSNGSYSFSNLTPGNYIVYAIPTAAADRADMYSVYYGNTAIWENASSISITNASLTSVNISFPSYTNQDPGWNGGSDNLSGQILDATGVSTRTQSGGSPVPVPNAVVSLLASNGLVDYTITDANGFFTFSNLIAGDYSVVAEYAGLRSATPFTQITVDGNSSGNEFVSVPLSTSSTTGVSSPGNVMQANVYPNPAQDQITIVLPVNISGDLSIELMNEMGVTEAKQNIHFTNGEANFSLNTLKKGLYIVRIKEQDAVYQVRVLKM